MSYSCKQAGPAVLFGFVMFGSVSTAIAAPIDVTVPGTTMPWNFSDELNQNRPFGLNDGTAPVVITLQQLGASPGQRIAIAYVSGSVCPGGTYPCGDANGDQGFKTNHHRGNSGEYFPSRYMKTPTYLCELVGAFTDANGEIVGRPFAVGDGPTQEKIPAGANQVQLGVNDDILSDNSGSWDVQVSTP
jgi:hypothetical protein